MDTRGEITTTDGHRIDTVAAAATIHAGICRWLLRTKIETINTADVLSCSKEIVKAKQARDVAVKALQLDEAPPSPWVIDVPKGLEDK